MKVRDKVRDIFSNVPQLFPVSFVTLDIAKEFRHFKLGKSHSPNQKMSILTNLLIVLFLENEVFCTYTGEVVLL